MIMSASTNFANFVTALLIAILITCKNIIFSLIVIVMTCSLKDQAAVFLKDNEKGSKFD